MSIASRVIRTVAFAALCTATGSAWAECPSQAKGASGIQVTLRVIKTGCTKTPSESHPAAAAPSAPRPSAPAPQAAPSAPAPAGARPAPGGAAPTNPATPEAAPPAPGVIEPGRIEPDPAKLPAAEPRRDAVIATSGDRSPPAVTPAVNRAVSNSTADVASTGNAGAAGEAAAAPKVQRGVPELTIGAEVTIRSPRLGTTPGKVQLRVGEQVLACEVTAWMDNRVTLVVPAFETVEDREATLEVSRADGRVYRKVPVKLLAEDAEVTVTR